MRAGEDILSHPMLRMRPLSALGGMVQGPAQYVRTRISLPDGLRTFRITPQN